MPVPLHSVPWVSPVSTKRDDTRRTLFGFSARSRRAKIPLILGGRKITIAKLSPSPKSSACVPSSRIATLVSENCIGGRTICSKQRNIRRGRRDDAGDGNGIVVRKGGSGVKGVG